ncbi:MAG: hypothetical protein JF615_08330 [Asticcacaulis sp.]|nr:hypothetical protein [Asticcacaulis sp.]
MNQFAALWISQAPSDVAQVQAIVDRLMPGACLFLAVQTAVSAVLTAAICRIVAGRSDDGLGYLSFGLPELRILVVYLVMGVINVSILTAAMVFGAGLGPAGPAAGLTLGVIAAGWLSVRLSLNAVQSFDQGRIDLFGSFALTRGVFWPLFGGYLMAWLLQTAVAWLCQTAIELDMLLTGGIDLPLIAGIAYGAPAAAYRELKNRIPAPAMD